MGGIVSSYFRYFLSTFCASLSSQEYKFVGGTKEPFRLSGNRRLLHFNTDNCTFISAKIRSLHIADRILRDLAREQALSTRRKPLFLDRRDRIFNADGRNRPVLPVWSGNVVSLCPLCAGQGLGDGIAYLLIHRYDIGQKILVALDVA